LDTKILNEVNMIKKFILENNLQNLIDFTKKIDCFAHDLCAFNDELKSKTAFLQKNENILLRNFFIKS